MLLGEAVPSTIMAVRSSSFQYVQGSKSTGFHLYQSKSPLCSVLAFSNQPSTNMWLSICLSVQLFLYMHLYLRWKSRQTSVWEQGSAAGPLADVHADVPLFFRLYKYVNISDYLIDLYGHAILFWLELWRHFKQLGYPESNTQPTADSLYFEGAAEALWYKK